MKKDFNPSKKIEEQLVLGENHNMASKIVTTEQTFIVVLNAKEYSNEQLISCSNFDEKELQFEIIQEFMDEKKNVLLSLFENEVLDVTWFNFIDLTKQTILENVELGLQLELLRTQEKIIYHQLGPVDNVNQGIMIYDNSSSLSEHIDKLNDNIKILYPKYLAIKPQEESGSGWAGMLDVGGDYSYGDLLSISGSVNYLGSELFGAEELSLKLVELREKYQKDSVEELYQTKDVEESLESKAIRLKIIETLLAQKIVENDKIQKNEIINIIKSPELLK